MKNITRERKILENRRLDLDACKGKVRKARAMQLQPVVSLYPSSYIQIYLNYSSPFTINHKFLTMSTEFDKNFSK
jgi:hypothetical protein